MKQTMINTTVTYNLEINGKLYVIKNVPARVCHETGEPFFSPTTVEHIQRVVRGEARPVRTMETPVFEYA